MEIFLLAYLAMDHLEFHTFPFVPSHVLNFYEFPYDVH